MWNGQRPLEAAARLLQRHEVADDVGDRERARGSQQSCPRKSPPRLTWARLPCEVVGSVGVACFLASAAPARCSCGAMAPHARASAEDRSSWVYALVCVAVFACDPPRRRSPAIGQYVHLAASRRSSCSPRSGLTRRRPRALRRRARRAAGAALGRRAPCSDRSGSFDLGRAVRESARPLPP